MLKFEDLIPNLLNIVSTRKLFSFANIIQLDPAVSIFSIFTQSSQYRIREELRPSTTLSSNKFRRGRINRYRGELCERYEKKNVSYPIRVSEVRSWYEEAATFLNILPG